MSKSTFGLSVFSVLLILTFLAGSVQAQDEPPVWEGEMPNISQFTPRYDEDAFPTAPVILDGGGGQRVAPVSPVNEFVYTKTPKFYFVRDFRADRYEIQIYDLNGSITLYSFKGAGTCNSGYCYLQPTTPLKNEDYYNGGGFYVWRVKARIEGAWEPNFTAYVDFVVLSKGFTSTFDSHMLKWYPVSGAWAPANGYLKSDGVANQYASVFYRDWFTNFDYTVVMKRKNNHLNTSALLVGGLPYPTGTGELWYYGLSFRYTNAGYWSLLKYHYGSITAYVSGESSSAIKPYDWNKLRIVMNKPYIDLWINGTYLGWLYSTDFSVGVVGIEMFRSSLPKEPLLVDKVVVKAITYPPFAEHDPAMQLGLNPVELDVDPNLLPFIPDESPTGTR